MDICLLCGLLGTVVTLLVGGFFAVWLIGLIVSSPSFWIGVIFLFVCLFVAVLLSKPRR